MWIPREISQKLLKTAASFPAMILTGPRQAGKTSLLRELFPNYRFVPLDLPSNAELAEKKPQDFISKYPPPVIIDEVQYAPKLFRHLKFWIDENRKKYGQFLLTGSQKFTLMKEVSESLAGRCAVLELETLSLHEIEGIKKVDTLKNMVLGGFPELHARPELDPQTFYSSYVATYLERDVRSLLSVGHLRDFERFLAVCALRSGHLLNKAELARDVGISPPTANEWLSVLHASNQVFLLEPWFSNKTKSIVKSPKLYLGDSGLLCHFLGINSAEELIKSPLAGSVWESFVFSEIRKRQLATQGKWAVYFWRDLKGLEVDFLVHQAGRFDIMEAKFSENPDSRDANSLRKVASLLRQDRVRSSKLVCRSPQSYPLDNEVQVIALSDL